MKYLVSSILGFSLFATFAFAANPKISPDIENLDPASTANVIVQFAEAPTTVQHKKVTDRGGVYRSTLSIVKAGSHAVPVNALSNLANDPDVVYISPDRPLHGMLDNTTAAVNAATAWSAGFTGAGIGVALIDSGVTPDSDLSSTLTYNQTFVTNDTHDYYGHGTHVAGILAGSGSRSLCYQCTRNLQGVAPGVSLLLQHDNFICQYSLSAPGAAFHNQVRRIVFQPCHEMHTFLCEVLKPGGVAVAAIEHQHRPAL